MIGKRISGRYEVLGLLGGGGMSTVYLARDMILDRPVAIKILRYDLADEEELRKRFHREALSATSLIHPHIVNIYDVGEDGELHYLVMEYVEGQTLKEYIQEKAPLPAARAVDIMMQLCDGISAAHLHGIIHRDIKPQNILMDGDGRVKLTDFGIAMALSATALTRTNSVMGTVHYLSPEQARGGIATKRSDLYSLGIVLYEMLTGKLPFSGESPVSIALKHLHEETPPVRDERPDIPQSLENVILKATAKNPAYRYPSAEVMLKDLSTVLSPERRDEPKFMPPPPDDEATKAMPAIKDMPGRPAGDTRVPEPAPMTETPPEPVTAKEQEQKQKRKRKKWPWLLAGTVILAALVGVLLYLLGVFGPKQAEVPDVTGKPAEEAMSLIRDAGLEIGGQTEEHSPDVEKGSVIRTSPGAGSLNDEGTEVDLVISAGEEPVELTDFTGRDYDSISEIVDEFGFKNVRKEEEYSDEPEGTVIRQEPEGGEKIVPSETELVLTVSKGIEKISTKDLSGFDEDELNEYARTSGFNIRITAEKPSDSVEAGRVLSQEPEAGTELERGATIKVVLSKGAEADPVKTFIQGVTIPYEPSEEGAAQKVTIYIGDLSHKIEEPAEEFEITEDTTKRIRMEIKEGGSATYRIERDGKTVAEETIPYE
ncbi:Stk1 family PASTA domain-containing Ser/Thr kinase [Edaphobacillus lindanitolerans]|uniref:Serine/threonine-protein kinase PrkC n=1 Tax=Edaphobacillus lindanitolerans TaxID=550447 RepID=A0A1U7PHG6_9BACI|nr:Stk1 family PASTA domain-containing Ser/Thr kinase [Edaphobacillus lindanitolerans]SIT67595.1 serine/threonine protein kinase [Edaphobacillus lindanitolerans]